MAQKILGSVAVADDDSDDSNDDVLLSIGWCFFVAAVSTKHLC